MKENSLSKINMRHKTGYMYINCWLSAKHNQIIFQKKRFTKWHNALLVKLSENIPKFFDSDVFPFGGSDFTVSKWEDFEK